MCGILGYSHRRRPLPEGLLDRALASLAHRGPDQCGKYSSREMSLGATRLRIVDLHGGDQPLFSPDRDTVVVFNGEIYNHAALRAELQRDGFRFQTHCDTEVVLHGFRRWGKECFARLRGMFAIAIWSEAERRLVLARDRMGIKPLYYSVDDEEIYFGSELKCILAHPAVLREISLAGLNCYLGLNYVPGPLTLVNAIKKLMPGQMLDWQRGMYTVSPYGSAVAPGCEADISLEAAAERLDQLLRAAVREQLACDVPVAVWLSGGLDSSTVLHYAAEEHSGPLQTYSITFSGRSFDEARYIQQVSQHYGTQHEQLDLTPDLALADAIHQMAYYSDEPSADAGALPTWFLAQMTRKGATVALSGEGADELFGGYITYQADRYWRFAQLVPAGLRRRLLAAAVCLPVSDEKIGFEYKLKRFLAGTLLSPAAAHVFWNGTFSEAERELLCAFADRAPWQALMEKMEAQNGVGALLAFDQRHYLPDDILYKVDRMSMAHSVEVRPPFLDERIVAFAASLPLEHKIDGRQTKRVLRHLMRSKLPASVVRRSKIGFDAPIHDWLRGALRPLLLETLTPATVADSGLFHWPAVERVIQRHLGRKENLGYHLWGLITLFIWMRRWNVQLISTTDFPTPVEAVNAAD